MPVDDELPGLEAMAIDDQMAIGETLGALLGGFGMRDASMLDAVYAEDADWVNAFGTVRKGRAEIIGYLHGLFKEPGFSAGKMVAPPENTLRRLNDQVVAVSSHLKIAGQEGTNGASIGLRDNFSLRILQKQPDARWLVVSEIYMDARTG